MTNTLLGPDDLAHLPGAPFTDGEIDDAVATLRGALGWHIAPVLGSEESPETVTLDVVDCEPTLRLPTRHLVSVLEIRSTITDPATVIDSTSYKVSTSFARVRRCSYWPAGYEAVEVDMIHGFATCPPELRPIVGQMIVSGRDGSGVVVQETVGPFSRSFSNDLRADLTDGQLDTLERLSVRNSWPARL